MIKNEKFDLTLLILVSVFLTIYLFFRTYVISLDGAFQYIPIAKDFASGFFRKALSHNQQPLYPFIIAVVSQWVPDFELAGKLVSSFFGILIIFPVYFLGKRIFDARIAFVSTLFLVIHPYIRRFSADVLKDSTYLFFIATALWFAWKAIQGEKKYLFLFIPIFSVLAYLVRPDGIEALLVVFFYVLFVKKFSTPGSKRTVILLLILSSCILLFPYLFYIRELRGEWTFSKAKSIVEMLGVGVLKDGVPLAHKILYSVKRLNLGIFAIGHPVYVLLLIIGFLKRGLLKGVFSRFRSAEGFLLSFCLLHYGVLFLLILNVTEWGGDGTVQVDQLSGRHVLPLLLFSIYWVGEGFMGIYWWICKKSASILLFHRLTPREQPAIIFLMLLVLILAIVLPKTLKPQRYERLPEKWAGIWIKNQSGEGTIIFTTVPRVAYYAGGKFEYIDFHKDKFDQIKASMAEKRALYLAIREREMGNFPQDAEAIKRDFVELARFEGKGMKKIVVYKLGR
jgi:4-amino-4-deoxy-L-arabinose transferase-like glycosyltransferase